MLWKRIGALVLATMLCLGLWACSAEDAPTLIGKDHRTIGLCVRRKADAPEYYEALAAGLRELGCGVLLEDCQNDQSHQNEKVRYLVNQGCQLLVVEPVMVSALEDVVAQAKAVQLPLVVLDREPEQALLDSYEKSYYLGYDSAQAGTAQAQLLDLLNIHGDINGDGTVSYMMLRGPEDHMDAQLITDACNQALAQQNTQLLCTAVAQWTLEDGRAQCAQALSQYGRDIEVILCNDAQLALGAVEAVKNGGWIPGQDVYILSVGSNAQLEALMAQGAVAATVTADTEQRVQLLVQTAQQLLEGNAVEKRQHITYAALVSEK